MLTGVLLRIWGMLTKSASQTQNTSIKNFGGLGLQPQNVDLVADFEVALIPTPVQHVFPLWIFWIAIALMLIKLSVTIAHYLHLLRHRKAVL